MIFGGALLIILILLVAILLVMFYRAEDPTKKKKNTTYKQAERVRICRRENSGVLPMILLDSRGPAFSISIEPD